jgi:electron transfer flavoprotein alpha subunit
MGDVIVFAEHQGGHFPKTTLVAINAGLEMARKRGGNCLAIVAGDGVDGPAADIAKYGVSKVIALEGASAPKQCWQPPPRWART